MLRGTDCGIENMSTYTDVREVIFQLSDMAGGSYIGRNIYRNVLVKAQ